MSDIAAATPVPYDAGWSGMMSAPELLPPVAGTAGQLLPPGAGGSLLRSTAFFDGAGATPYVLVLAAWIAIGLLGICVGARRRHRPAADLANHAGQVQTALAR